MTISPSSSLSLSLSLGSYSALQLLLRLVQIFSLHSTPMADSRHLLLFFPLLLALLSPRHVVAQSSQPPSPPNQQQYSTTFSPTMAIVIVVLITAFFFIGFFSIYFRQCAGDAEYFAGSVRGGVRLRRQQTQRRGLAPEVLETFPTFVYTEVKELKISKGALECAVCLTEFEDDDKLRLLPGCNHVFHPDCIDAWLSSHVTCPVCRANLADAAAAADAGPDQDHEPEENRQPGEAPAADAAVSSPTETPPRQVVIIVDPPEAEEHRLRKLESVELAKLGSRRREHLSRSVRRTHKFSRSHSTGHSMAPPQDGGAVDRYTLRLPDHAMKEILAARKFHRSASCVAFPATGEGSSRRGNRYGGEGSSRGGRSIRLGRSDRWPSFFGRTLSAKFPSWAGGRRGGTDGDRSVKKGDEEGSTNRGKFAGVMTPLDCLVGGGGALKAEADDESATSILARRV